MLSSSSAILQALMILPALAARGHRNQLQKRDYPAPNACSGYCEGLLHDPNVVYNNGTYFRFVTDNDIGVSTAPAIGGPWTDQGSAIEGGSIIDLPGNDDLWAPDVTVYDGTFYLYYAVSTVGSQNSDIGVATSTTGLPGSWTDHGSIGIPSNNASYNRIDPNLFTQHAGPPFYLAFGSYWENIFQVPMSDDLLTVDGDIVHLEYNTTVTSAPDEGSYQFWYPVNGIDYFYLFFSEGDCCGTPTTDGGNPYRIMVCRSTSPTGGFVDEDGVDCLAAGGTEVYAGSTANDCYAPGGEGVFVDPATDDIILYYHYMKPSVGYAGDQFQFGYNILDFTSGWPVVVG